MKVYYIEYMDTVKFFYNECAIEIEKGDKVINFICECIKKYGKNIKFKELI